MNTSPTYLRKRALALGLEGVGAVLTAASNHPLVVERQGPHGVERGFRLKLHDKQPDAPLSPFFLNLRTPDNPKPGPLKGNIIILAAACMHQALLEKKVEYDAVAGVPNAGDPFAEALAKLSGKPLIHMEKGEVDGKRFIAGIKGYVPMEIGNVLLVDDLVTKADSKIEAIEVLREAGMEVSDVVVLVDREQGGAKELDEWRCTLHAVFAITELLDFYVACGKMSEKLHADIVSYLVAA
ncbi:MAG: hypothetical protein WCT45_00330 [Candidatus Paceibacterota bacterium]|jgi:uridine monophosphate synthetase